MLTARDLAETFELEELRSAVDQISTADMFFNNQVTVALPSADAVTASAATFADAVLLKRGWIK